MNIEEFLKIFENVELDADKIVIKENLHDTVVYIVSKYSYNLLKEIVAVDLGSENGIELIYRLYSTEDEEEILLSFVTFGEADSVTDIFESAQADENEIYDLFGVKFTGNEKLKRLYLPQSWKGHPLRKDYIQDDTRLAWNDNNNA